MNNFLTHKIYILGSYRVWRICSDAFVIESFTVQDVLCSDEQTRAKEFTSRVLETPKSPHGVGCLTKSPPLAKDDVDVNASDFTINLIKRVLNAAFEEVDVQKLSLSLKSARTGKE
ncbi:hypothetical protein MTR_1g056455 [Medicago truncatula]|uniref:Uncharacterized protein n=1 Tax=Medicago truncatula TaxID=3880 RepID=A0A072VIQ4_MEDTR|nr:hypothetical protein MTR_1g056455 [Medicago truncatula]